MALINLLHVNQSLSLAIWRIAESEKTLQSLLSGDKYKPYPLFKNTNRRKEWFATRCLIQILHPSLVLKYQKNGKPLLFNNSTKSAYEISISHCQNMLAIAINNQNKTVGLDIEWISNRPLKIAMRFMNDNELKLFSENKLNATIVWSAKEALYKLYGNPVEDYRNSINVLAIDAKTIKACYKSNIHLLQYHMANGLLIVWVC